MHRSVHTEDTFLDYRKRPARFKPRSTQRILVITIVLAAHVVTIFCIVNRGTPHVPASAEPAPTTLFLLAEQVPIIEPPIAIPSIPLPRSKPLVIVKPAIEHETTEPPAVPPAPIDWQAEAGLSAETVVAAIANQPRTRTFDVRDLPSMRMPRVLERSDFPWDELEGKRVGVTKDGTFFIKINEYCLLVFLIPVCHIGKMPARGDIFKDMGKIKPEEPLGDNPVPPPRNP